MTTEKKQGPVEDFLDGICYPHRDEMIEKRQEDRQEQDRTRRYEAIMDVLNSDTRYWPSQCEGIAKIMDLTHAFNYLQDRINKKGVAYTTAKYRHDPEDIGDAFMSQIQDNIDLKKLGKLILSALNDSIENVENNENRDIS